MRKGVRVWVCEECGKRETWRKGWRWFVGVEGVKNKTTANDLILPWAVCSDACEDASMKRWQAEAAKRWKYLDGGIDAERADGSGEGGN